MPFFSGWFSDDYLDTWFDEGSSSSTPTSGHGGISRSRLLSNVAPRPPVPPWRQIPGPTGQALTDIRAFLTEVQQRNELWGTHVRVEFSGPGVSVPVPTGLGGPATGYKIVRADADIRVWDGTPTTPVDPKIDRGVHWLQASGAGTVTLNFY
jgi:hypothetical protein